ncbi:MAG: hypothetical protein P9M13_01905 [Candidatus Ancaeobacter aquaticus]|nr:hypothetical protein [Candidatus Ancaeobacter aquaticus]
MNTQATHEHFTPLQEVDPLSEFLSKEEEQSLLALRISDLQLKIEGSTIEPFIKKLLNETASKGIKFIPPFYLADEWGCPNEIPAIAIPFYLVDKKLSRLEVKALKEIENNDDEEISQILRHEMGHALNYAYKLYNTPEWKKTFGNFYLPYKEEYRPNPFSKKFVKHLTNWYAQKHPDDDFAETFAVWLTPKVNWQEEYKGWGALKKLEYVDRVIPTIKDLPPLVYPDLSKEIMVHDLHITLRDFFKKKIKEYEDEFPDRFDIDLKEIFSGSETKKHTGSAVHFLRNNQKQLTDIISHWTGENKYVIKPLFKHFIVRTRKLKLTYPLQSENTIRNEIAVFATALVMNYYHTHKF